METRPSRAMRGTRKLSRAARRRQRRVLRIMALVLGLMLAVAATQFAIHAVRTDPRDARTITERELRVNTLQRGEQVVVMASAFQRPALDYFRATRGVLVLTNRRLLFLGLEPRDLLGSGEEPPTFDERDFPIDTLARVSEGRTFFKLAKAIVVSTPREELAYGIPSPSWDDGRRLLDSVLVRHRALYAEGRRQKAIREKAAAEARVAEAEAQKAQYYTVQRGDALASVAAQWNTSPEQLREWNHLPDNRIKVGQRLLVRPARK